MEIAPILSTWRRNPVGALLIGLQIALTVAIVSNSLAVIGEHLQHMRRPTGLDEANIFTFANRWVGSPSDVKARIQADVAAVRSLPGVVDAATSNSFPLRGGGFTDDLSLKPAQKQGIARGALYMADEHGLSAWGLRLVAGRWFTKDEIGELGIGDRSIPPAIIITKALADAMFPEGSALGREVYLLYLAPSVPTRIVGIVERAQSPWAAASWAESFIERSVFVPYQFVNNGLFYVVRTRPGQQALVMREVEKKLYEIDGAREIAFMQPFAISRARAYRFEHAINMILGAVCALLLTVTAVGIVGLSTYWVAQRRRQIGVRRALGARRVDIVRYFHTENLLISVAGAVLGIALGIAANLWLATSLQLTRMSIGFIVSAAAIVVGFSQLAVIWPALRASAVPPALAARGG